MSWFLFDRIHIIFGRYGDMCKESCLYKNLKQFFDTIKENDEVEVQEEIIFMSNVKIKKIPFNERYVNLALADNIHLGAMTANLKALYEFIDKNEHGRYTSIYEYGNAYRAILKRARLLAGSRKYIISKRQVAALINPIISQNGFSTKIPYACDYIFRAIFEIFDNYKNDPMVSIPSELTRLYGKIRRDAFYSIQCSQYEYAYMHNLLNDREELREIREALLNDLCSEECALGKRV